MALKSGLFLALCVGLTFLFFIVNPACGKCMNFLSSFIFIWWKKNVFPIHYFIFKYFNIVYRNTGTSRQAECDHSERLSFNWSFSFNWRKYSFWWSLQTQGGQDFMQCIIILPSGPSQGNCHLYAFM